MRLTLLLAGCATLLVSGCASHPDEASGAPPWHDVGAVDFPITTETREAQRLFNVGLGLGYGFQHEEAVRVFEQAAAADPLAPMPHWGMAWALGPNYNQRGISEEVEQRAIAALEQARARAAIASPLEHALLEALATRYGPRESGARRQRDLAYVQAMDEVRKRFGDHDDVNALAIEAMMQLRPWRLWSAAGEPAEETPAILAALEEARRRWPEHPALCHFTIHALEASPYPEQALDAARTLDGLDHRLPHLIHMPSHIYAWTGHYADVVRVNREAVVLDDAYLAAHGPRNVFTAYRLHDLHFVVYGAMFTGQRAIAMRYARELESRITEERMGPRASSFDVFSATPIHVMVRFGMWEELLAEPRPEDPFHGKRAIWRYGRTLALAALDRVEEARTEYERFVTAKEAVPASRRMFTNSLASILEVADPMLRGEVAYRAGEHEEAFRLLELAVERDLALNYAEPWGWMQPARHALGALLTEQGEHERAAEVYRANLERFPENGWSLHGLAECLRAMGQATEAREVEVRFTKAWQDADVEIPGSCFCRTE